MSVFEQSKIVAAILQLHNVTYTENPIYRDGVLIAVIYDMPSPIVGSLLAQLAPLVHYITAKDSNLLSFSV